MAAGGEGADRGGKLRSRRDRERGGAVARRYALSPQQLFAWRRAARQPLAEAPAPESLFVPAVIAAPRPEPAARRRRKQKAARDGVIELEIDGVAMRVGRGADTRTVAAVIRALKATT